MRENEKNSEHSRTFFEISHWVRVRAVALKIKGRSHSRRNLLGPWSTSAKSGKSAFDPHRAYENRSYLHRLTKNFRDRKIFFPTHRGDKIPPRCKNFPYFNRGVTCNTKICTGIRENHVQIYRTRRFPDYRRYCWWHIQCFFVAGRTRVKSAASSRHHVASQGC